MSAPGDRVEQYLRALRARLRTTPQDADRITAEAEDHLREAVAAGLAAGLSPASAEEVAISSFGSVRAVVRAHAASHGKAAVLASYVMAVWKLAWMLLLAASGVGAVALIFDLTASRQFTRTTAAFCAIAGAALLTGYCLVQVVRRRRGRVLRYLTPRAFFPAAALTVFGGLGVCCGVATGVAAARGGGPGMWLSGTIVCAVVVAADTLRLVRISRPRPPAVTQLRRPKPARIHRPKPARVHRPKPARRRPFRGIPARSASMMHAAYPGWPPAPVRALRRRRRRYAMSARRRRMLRTFWFPTTISLPGGRRLERRKYMFWRVRLPLWAVFAVAGWLVLGLWGIPLGLAVAVVAELLFSYRRPHGFRPRRDPGGLAGVREPRRPRPTGGAGAVELPSAHGPGRTDLAS
jgi:hypothetical protein